MVRFHTGGPCPARQIGKVTSLKRKKRPCSNQGQGTKIFDRNDKYVYNTTMLKIIKSLHDPLIDLVKDDPVRPEIPADWRVGLNREILTLVDEQNNPLAVVCVAFCDAIPSSVEELLVEAIKPNTAIFYTIWSYANGGGRSLIGEAQQYIKDTYNHITRFVTLSPTTELARRFHTKNGAKVLRQNPDTVNYEYE